MWTITGWYEEARALAAEDPAYVRGLAASMLNPYRASWPDATDDEIESRLQASNEQRLGNVPDLNTYPELRGMRELVEAGWRGTRDGAALSDLHSAVMCDGLRLYHTLQRCPSPIAPGCTAVYFPDSDRGPLFAKNLDTTLDQPPGVPLWSDVTLNEHLAGGGVSCGIWCDEQSPESFPAPVLKLVGRYCRTTDEAVDLLTRYNAFWGPGNFAVVDRDQNVAMIEKSANRIGVRRSEDGFGFVTAMTMQEPGMKTYLEGRRAESLAVRGLPDECADTAYWAEADHRHELLSDMLDEAREAPTVEKLRSMMQMRDPERGKVCYDGETLVPGGPPSEYTIRTAIWLMREGRILWWVRDGDTPSFENPQPEIECRDVGLWN